MCQPPWSDRDLFIFVQDCHIYLPAHILICSLTIFFGGLCLLYGISEYFKRNRKDQPISSMVLGFFSLVNYLIIVSTGMTFADRNLGINILHAIVRANIWISIIINATRHFEVMVSVDAHTVAKSRQWYSLLNKVHYIIYIISFLMELIGMIIATVDTRIEMIDLIGSIAIILIVINSVPRVLYAWKLRRIILSIKTVENAKFYQPIQKQLEGILSTTIISGVIGTVIIFLWIFVYVIRTNLYIAYGIQLVQAPLTGIANLANSGAHENKAENGNSIERTKTEGHSASQKSTHPPTTPTTPSVRALSTSDLNPNNTKQLHTSNSHEALAPLVRTDSQDELALSSSKPVLPTVQELGAWNLNSNSNSTATTSTPIILTSSPETESDSSPLSLSPPATGMEIGSS